MNVVSNPTSESQLFKLRAKHQEQAKFAAKAGLVPKAFLGDPTFKELVSAQDKFRGSDLSFVWYPENERTS